MGSPLVSRCRPSPVLTFHLTCGGAWSNVALLFLGCFWGPPSCLSTLRLAGGPCVVFMIGVPDARTGTDPSRRRRLSASGCFSCRPVFCALGTPCRLVQPPSTSGRVTGFARLPQKKSVRCVSARACTPGPPGPLSKCPRCAPVVLPCARTCTPGPQGPLSKCPRCAPVCSRGPFRCARCVRPLCAPAGAPVGNRGASVVLPLLPPLVPRGASPFS